MIREIKFRAWDVLEQKMHEWSDTFFYDTSPVTKYSGDFSYIDDDMILLQFTGLKDRNGKDVYYRDIVEYEGSTYLVEWDEDDTGFYLAWDRHLENPKSEEHIIGSCINESQVIGNFYENEALLNTN